jgi:hypothetical protein
MADNPDLVEAIRIALLSSNGRWDILYEHARNLEFS